MNLLLPEIVAIGIFDVHIAFPSVSVTHNRRTTMFEIELPVEDGGISYIDTEEMPITSDMIICAKPGQVRHTRAPFKCYFIHMILTEGSLYDTLSSLPAFIKVEQKEAYLDIFRNLCNYYETAVKEDELLLFTA